MKCWSCLELFRPKLEDIKMQINKRYCEIKNHGNCLNLLVVASVVAIVDCSVVEVVCAAVVLV